MIRFHTKPGLLLLAATAGLLPLSSQAAWVTFADATGWTDDVVYGTGETGAPITASIDSGPGQTDGASLYEFGASGLTITGSGLPTDSTISFTGSGASMQFQPFDHTNNALMVEPESSGTLTLAVPASMTTLALYGLTGNGSVSGTVTIHYADSTSQVFSLGAIGQDWFGGGSIAYIPFAREYPDGSFEFDGENPRIYEQLYTTNTLSPVVSVDISNDILEDGSGGHLAVMAISGNAVPEPSAVAMAGALGLFGLARRRRGC